MKRAILIAFIIPIMILSSCENVIFSKGDAEDKLEMDKQIIFISDDENIEQEAEYYNALLDIKRDYPKEFENIKITFKEGYDHTYDIEEFPSLILIEKEDILAKIEGSSRTKEEIMQTISRTFLSE